MSSDVSLEFHWKGSYTYNASGEWDISCLDIELPGLGKEIEASIDTSLPPSDQQHLMLKISDIKPKEAFSFISNREAVRKLSYPIELVKTMKISARIFQVRENRSIATMHPNGQVKYAQYAHRDCLPVNIGSFPKFEEGETYEIVVANEDSTLHATFGKKATEDERLSPEAVISGLEAAISELKQERDKVNEKLSRAPSGEEHQLTSTVFHAHVAVANARIVELEDALEQMRVIAAELKTSSSPPKDEPADGGEASGSIQSVQEKSESDGTPSESDESEEREGCTLL